MRLRIVISHEPRASTRVRTSGQALARSAAARRVHGQARSAPGQGSHGVSHGFTLLDPAWLQQGLQQAGRALLAAARVAWRLLCAARGHRYVLKLQPRRLALHCTACGHTTHGWSLDEVEPYRPKTAAPRFLELVKKRG